MDEDLCRERCEAVDVNDRVVGAGLLAGGVLALIGYLALLFTWFYAAVVIVVVIMVAAFCFVLAWIGYTLLTTPAPTRVETPAPVGEGATEKMP